MNKRFEFLFALLLCSCAAATPTPLPEMLFPPTTTPFAVYLTEIAASTPQPTLGPTPSTPARPGGLVKVADLPENVGDAYRGMGVTADGGLWVYTSQWVARFDAPDGWTTVAEVPEGEEIFGMDTRGSIYAAPAGAATLSLWRNGNWVSYGENEGWLPIDGDYAWTGAIPSQRPLIDAQGHIWLVTAQDVRRFDGQAWQAFSAEDLGMTLASAEDANRDFTLLFDPSSGAVWLAECDWGGPGPVGGGGVRRYLDGEWQGAGWPVDSRCVTSLGLAEDGALWAGAQPSVWRFDPQAEEWSSFGAPQPPEDSRPGYALDIAPDAAGGAWIVYTFCGGASCGNLFIVARWQEGAWVVLKDGKDFAYYRLIARAGTAYVWSDTRLYLLDGDEVSPIGASPVVDWVAGSGWLPYFVANDENGMSVWIEK